jgi:hypothetical protein
MKFGGAGNLGSSDLSGQCILMMHPLQICVLFWPWCSYHFRHKTEAPKLHNKAELFLTKQEKLLKVLCLKTFIKSKILSPSIMD